LFFTEIRVRSLPFAEKICNVSITFGNKDDRKFVAAALRGADWLAFDTLLST
jgi:hypothetical protein